MVNTLVEPSALADFAGAPFSQAIVDSAAGRVRREAGWHIAPQVTETFTVDAHGGTMLVLPTLLLVDVTEVRDVAEDTPRVLTGWTVVSRGELHREGGWPCGVQRIEVDVVHGYTETPPELLPVIADFCRQARTDPRISQESLGAWSTSYRAGDEVDELRSTLGEFSLRKGFG